MRDRSLRHRLLVRLWLPLAVLLVTGALISFVAAYHFANVVHDRWLLDSAMTLTSQLRVDTGRLSLELPPPAVEMFEWDSVDRIYEEVVSSAGVRLFGNANFPPAPATLKPGEASYYDSSIDGDAVRIVALSVPSPADPARRVTIQVGETMRKRQALVTEILLLLIPIQAFILLAAGLFIWYAVTSSLSGLKTITATLRRYDPARSATLPDAHNAPSEILPFIAALKALSDKIAESRAMQQRFVANAAHQLRTPLTSLQVQTERALRETDPELHLEALTKVRAAVARMRHLTHQLLTLTRSDASTASRLEMCDVDLSAVAQEELERWADAAVKRSIDLGYDGPERGPIVRGEPQLLKELIGNLVDNAIQYGRAGGGVTLGVRDKPLRLYVEDDGAGIHPDDRERVIDPFYRPPGSAGEGCGLGLTIAAEIAARHGGRLRIRDHEPTGTRVEVLFESP